MDGYFDGTLGSDPVHQDRPHHVGQTLRILDDSVLIQKADHEIITPATNPARGQ
jgi:hypothetical protein